MPGASNAPARRAGETVAFSKEIRAAKADGRLVRVTRDTFDEEGNAGYVVATGRSWFVMELVTHSARFDGMACMRYSDVTSVASEQHTPYLERALEARGAVRATQAPVNLTSLQTIIETSAKAFPVITLHVPSEEMRYECFIGKVIELGAEAVDFAHITRDGEWEESLREIPYSEIMRVDFGGDYEEAMFLAVI
jgi:hypothetical protein